jgi:hypothetical protein
VFQEHLLAKAKPHSPVLFYFSGHGSQMKDEVNGDETLDHYDETICPYDTRVGDVRDISDDEIAGLLYQLRTITDNVTVIFDSCHSGEATKTLLAPQSRTLPPDDRPPPPAPSYALGSEGFAKAATLKNDKYTVLSACHSDQESFEIKCHGNMRGAFTYYLGLAMDGASEQTTLHQILEEARAGVQSVLRRQSPTSEGNIDRFMFGEPMPVPDPFFVIHQKGLTWMLQGGSVHGVTAGSVFNCYPTEVADFASATPLGKVQVKAVTAFEAELELLPPLTSLADTARAVELRHVYPKADFGVFVDMPAGGSKTAVLKAIEAVPGLRTVDNAKECGLVVSDKDVRGAAAGGVVLMDPTRATELVRLEEAVTKTEDVEKQLRRWSCWITSASVVNPKTTFEGEFTLVKLERAKGVRGASGLFEPEQQFVEGDRVEITVKNTSNREGYLYVLDYSSDGEVSLLVPPQGVKILPGGKWSQRFRVVVPPDRQRVFDLVKVVMSSKTVDFSPVVTTGGKVPKVPDQFVRGLVPDGDENRGEEEYWATMQRVFESVKAVP